MNKPKPSPKPSRPLKSFKYRRPFDKVYQFNISLDGVEPKIWRGIQVPDSYLFWDLHCAITDSLGWLDYHLHLFSMLNPKTGEKEMIGMPDDDTSDALDAEILPDWERKISDYFTLTNATCQYEYDFGDSWGHKIIFEASLPREDGVVYPRCIEGARACPPEDVGGVPGYERFQTAVKYQNAVDHDELLQWVGGWFDPDWFDLSLVRFEDPDLRWDIAYGDAKPKKGMRMVQYHHLHE